MGLMSIFLRPTRQHTAALSARSQLGMQLRRDAIQNLGWRKTATRAPTRASAIFGERSGVRVLCFTRSRCWYNVMARRDRRRTSLKIYSVCCTLMRSGSQVGSNKLTKPSRFATRTKQTAKVAQQNHKNRQRHYSLSVLMGRAELPVRSQKRIPVGPL